MTVSGQKLLLAWTLHLHFTSDSVTTFTIWFVWQSWQKQVQISTGISPGSGHQSSARPLCGLIRRKFLQKDLIYLKLWTIMKICWIRTTSFQTPDPVQTKIIFAHLCTCANLPHPHCGFHSFLLREGRQRMKEIALLLLFPVLGAHTKKSKDRPHIVFILADDLGWNEVLFNILQFFHQSLLHRNTTI